MRHKYTEYNGCGVVLAFQIFFISLAFWLAWWCIDKTTEVWFGVDLPWWADVIIGLLCNGFTLVAGILSWALQLAGVETPIFAGVA